ncbi:DUF3000 domain-containing protein [Propioniciclava sp.]|uniref:DUF3000 domain-containing protein n=1 Tax=Propioniciclava sp. TaxID=2038686 RepID=UPI0026304153|nr:DUF3000 domain-containing protein [Propioniciclava sp.]
MGRPESGLFDEAVNALLSLPWRPELAVEEIPAPQRIAPYAVAIAADVEVGDDELGNGRLVLLHDPDGNPAWDGTFRCVTFARSVVDPEMAIDPLLGEVGWSWLTDALQARDAAYTAPSGTVTAVSSKSFGSMEGDPDKAEVEIRASWTPLLATGAGIVPHVLAWQDLLCMVAGLPLLPDGVVALDPHRPGRRRRR